MCDAGGIAMSKDTGPLPGFGDVVRIIRPSSSASTSSNDDDLKSDLGTETGWRLGRISQEHGILIRKPGAGAVRQAGTLRVGDMIEIVGQHACLAAAAHPWYYVVDSSVSKGVNSAGDQPVVDIWVPCKGW